MKKRLELNVPTSCLNKAGDDETLFVLRGKDKAAAETIRAWVMERINRGMNAAYDGKIMEALECAQQMEKEAEEAETPKTMTVKLRRFVALYNGIYTIVWASDVPGGYTEVWEVRESSQIKLTDSGCEITVSDTDRCGQSA